MIKVIACSIFKDYIQQLSLSTNDYDISYLPIQSHNQPTLLAKEIQQKLDENNFYEKIILLYGVCGAMIFHLEFPNIPTYILKAHDCASILLGGYSNFQQSFHENLSSSWTCKSLLESNSVQQANNQYKQWVEKYGEEQADYLQEVLFTTCDTYITMGETAPNGYRKILCGDIKYLENILTINHPDLLMVNQEDQLYLTNDEQVLAIK